MWASWAASWGHSMCPWYWWDASPQRAWANEIPRKRRVSGNMGKMVRQKIRFSQDPLASVSAYMCQGQGGSKAKHLSSWAPYVHRKPAGFRSSWVLSCPELGMASVCSLTKWQYCRDMLTAFMVFFHIQCVISSECQNRELILKVGFNKGLGR